MAEKNEACHSFSKKKKIIQCIYLAYCLILLTYKVNKSRKIPTQNSLIYFCKEKSNYPAYPYLQYYRFSE